MLNIADIRAIKILLVRGWLLFAAIWAFGVIASHAGPLHEPDWTLASEPLVVGWFLSRAWHCATHIRYWYAAAGLIFIARGLLNHQYDWETIWPLLAVGAVHLPLIICRRRLSVDWRPRFRLCIDLRGPLWRPFPAIRPD